MQTTQQSGTAFQKPSGFERVMNRLVGSMVSAGIGPRYMRLLEVRGRKSGKLYATPVNVLESGGKLWLVAPRGRTQWSLNVEQSGELALRRGGQLERYKIRITEPSERPLLLKQYLDTYVSQVQRYFDVRAGSPVDAFAPVAERYPVYELIAA